MADVYCPLCGKKNWIPDSEESACFFCGAPLSPRTDSAQDAPLPKPKMSVPPGAEHSPFAAQGAPAPSGQTGASSDQNTEQLPRELAYLAEFISEDLGASPPKGAENLPGIMLSFRQWFIMNTIYICTLTAIVQYLMSGPAVSEMGTVLIPIVLIGATCIIPFVSEILPFKAQKPGNESETISFRGFLSAVSFAGVLVGGLVGILRLGLLEGTVTAILAGVALSMLAHYIKLLSSK